MDGSAARYADWKAPAEDGQVLIWPTPAELLNQTRHNARIFSTAEGVRIQNVPLAEVRTQMRRWVGHADERPLIATGHQAELYHPGVWAKNALIDAIARRVDGAAYHVAVDTDEPKHLHLRWPGGVERLTDDPALSGAKWAALLEPPTPAHLNHLSEAFAAAVSGWDFDPLVPQFLDSLRRLSLESPTLPAALVNALHELDWSLDLRHHELLPSPVCRSEPYLLFVYHVLARSGEFAVDYNEGLESYRQGHRIRTPGRPMPNLAVSADRCEVPFWLDELSIGQRSRATVVRTAHGSWALRIEGADEFVFAPGLGGWEAASRLNGWLRRNDFRLAPRALMLTMVLRLLTADQFVHGIGGGRYDQITDRLIERHFRVEAPRFSVTTATLYFPDAVGRQRTCVSCILHEGHRLRHRLLGDEKGRYVEAIAAAPRGSTERAMLFFQMRDRLQAASERSPALGEWARRLEEARQREIEEQQLFDRELFYAIQPRERLAGLIEQYRRAFAGVPNALHSEAYR